ncbi:unnamed protein product [Protopolystoma xenopodis]|uniref:Serine palmitoyltransferase 1 n=1 Tax=Protopolystoma xenopodis TaxID=117903 RepID=A0A3S5BPA4_9PLAT|nr:unnamed protein product [Protopolystoma xenopodis]
MIYSALRAPTYHIYFEILLIIGIVWLLFKRSYKIQENVELTEKEKLTLIREWTPDSLVPAEWEVPAHLSKHFHVGASTVLGKYVEYENKDPISSESHAKVFLNLSSFNFLNFVGEKRLNEAAIKSMHKYGVGSCGPRGFYGTFDVHLDLEQILEKFLGVEEVAVYSYGFSTVASAIPSYAKRTDVIFADEGISLACFQGLVASRSRICFFRHNDLAHLEQLLMKQALEDQKDMKKAQATRRFLVIEGLYLDYGDICPLPELIALKYKYKVRIILDETVSFGVLGSTGRGVTEHFGIEPEHIDLITGWPRSSFVPLQKLFLCPFSVSFTFQTPQHSLSQYTDMVYT